MAAKDGPKGQSKDDDKESEEWDKGKEWGHTKKDAFQTERNKAEPESARGSAEALEERRKEST